MYYSVDEICASCTRKNQRTLLALDKWFSTFLTPRPPIVHNNIQNEPFKVYSFFAVSTERLVRP